MTRELVLFTTNHPFTHTGGETMFVEPELPLLAREFNSVLVVPLHVGGRQLELPPGVRLDRSLAERWQRGTWRHMLGAPAWPAFFPELVRGWRQGGWVGAARVWRWAAIASATWAWLRARPAPDACRLLYTYWRGGQTLAAVRWVAEHPRSVAVTRVHRYELYDEAFDPPFQPWISVYQQLTRTIAVARQGRDYLQDRGVDPSRLMLARLGVAAARVRASASTDGVWRVVSCSNVIPLKRVDRVGATLIELARRHPDRRVEWTHFGAGPSLDVVRAALIGAPANFAAMLAGQVPNERVLDHYCTQPVDLFVLLSESEGLPVSIQEALAHGIPVVATNVGGVADAFGANGDNGALLSAEATVEQIATVLEQLLLAPAAEQAARREAAWKRWALDFDAERNHAALARILAAL